MNKMEKEPKETAKETAKEMTKEDYIQSLTETEKLAMEIARQHLGSSFDITKSVGFLKFLGSH